MSSNQSQDRLEREMNLAAANALSDAIRDPRSAWLAIILTTTAEIVAVAAARIGGDKIEEFFDQENSMYILFGVPFVIGLIFAFAVFRLIQLKFRSPRHGPLQSEWNLWLFAIAGGLANTIALFLLYAAR
jgi:drug/metabolite transporter (DMT)-like permease